MDEIPSSNYAEYFMNIANKNGKKIEKKIIKRLSSVVSPEEKKIKELEKKIDKMKYYNALSRYLRIMVISI